ncbi:MAG: deoxyribose-phosphate aldolase [Desulfurococcaceae archaeon]
MGLERFVGSGKGPEEVLREIDPAEFASAIDHTMLKPAGDLKLLEKYADDCRRYGFRILIVPPSLVPYAREMGVRVGTVIGFPNGYAATRAKVAELEWAAEQGAEEADVVMNIALFKSGLHDAVLEDLKAVVSAARERGVKVVKVIIETGLLNDSEKAKALELVVASGADFVKTSTGFLGEGATIHDVSLLYGLARGRVQVKASGGIRHAMDALAMISAGASRIGTSAGDKIFEELLALKGIRRG